jgi:predicted DNA-binding transcriptional regulator AlpA
VSAAIRQTLAVLVADPERIEGVAPQALPELLGELEALRAKLLRQLMASAAPAPAPPASREPDRLLSADQAAALLGVSRRWVYRRASSLPFTRRIGRGTLRFSLRGLERWREARR